MVLFAAISALPMALAFIAQQFGVDTELASRRRFGPLDGRDRGWLTLTGVLLLVGLGYAVAGLGALAGSMAPVLLGPSQAERIAALEARAARLAERNRLARELHDSVGHALTVATLQAGAARELLDTDPEFVRRALTAIEETGRTAMDDLDHVLGLLRETTDAAGPSAAPQRTLADLDRLVADARRGRAWRCTRIARRPRRAARGGVPGGLPDRPGRADQRRPARPRAGDAAAGRAPATRLELGAGQRGGPPRDRGPPRRGGGRGLDGMRERVLLLGGRITAGPDGDRLAGPGPPADTEEQRR